MVRSLPRYPPRLLHLCPPALPTTSLSWSTAANAAHVDRTAAPPRRPRMAPDTSADPAHGLCPPLAATAPCRRRPRTSFPCLQRLSSGSTMRSPLNAWRHSFSNYTSTWFMEPLPRGPRKPHHSPRHQLQAVLKPALDRLRSPLDRPLASPLDRPRVTGIDRRLRFWDRRPRLPGMDRRPRPARIPCIHTARMSFPRTCFAKSPLIRAITLARSAQR